MPTDTLYPSLDARVDNVPGFGISWAATIAATNGTAVYNSVAATWVAIHSNPMFDSKYCYRSIFVYDTSVLPDNATVTAAVFRVTPSAAPLGTGYLKLFGPSTPASDTACVTEDFDQVGANVWSDELNIPGFSSGVARDFTLNAAGIAGINVSGKTRFGVKTSWDYNATAAGVDTDNGVLCHFSEATTESNRPRLLVTYTVPGVGPMRSRTSGLIVPGRFVR